MKVISLITVLLFLSLSAFGQKPDENKRAVKVTLLDNAEVSGALVKLQDDSITLHSSIGETKIGLEKVAKIEFTSKEIAVKDKKPELLQIVKSIRALAVAAPDFSLLQYHSRLGDIKAATEEAIRQPVDQPIKVGFALALTHLDLAGRAAKSINGVMSQTFIDLRDKNLSSAILEADKIEKILNQ